MAKITEKQLQKRRGQWLEAFLNPETKVDDYYSGSGKRPGFRTLGCEALDILGITEKYDLDNDCRLRAFDMIQKAPKEVQKFYDFENIEFYLNSAGNSFEQLAKYDNDWTKQVVKGSDPLKLNSTGLLEAFDQAIGDYEENFFLKQFFLIDEVYSVLIVRLILTKLFKIIASEINPWEQTLYIDNVNRNSFNLYFHIEKYYGVHERLYKDDKKQTIIFKREFELPDHENLLLPWKCAGVTIAIDFLKSGGKFMVSKGFLFCENCGRFKFIDRLNTKDENKNRYCSDICRTTTNNKQRKNGTS